MPKKVKHRKWHKGRNKGLAHRGSTVAFGKYAMKTMERGRISSRQIEATRRSITRFLNRDGKVWIRIFPDRPVTSKGTEVPMGGGKGDVDHFVAQIKPGRILFEIEGVPEETAREAMRRASHKLPVKVKFVVS